MERLGDPQGQTDAPGARVRIEGFTRGLMPAAAVASPLAGVPFHTTLVLALMSLAGLVVGGARYATEWSDALAHIRDTWWPRDDGSGSASAGEPPPGA